jgi:hypothetical protein
MKAFMNRIFYNSQQQKIRIQRLAFINQELPRILIRLELQKLIILIIVVSFPSIQLFRNSISTQQSIDLTALREKQISVKSFEKSLSAIKTINFNLSQLEIAPT